MGKQSAKRCHVGIHTKAYKKGSGLLGALPFARSQY
jgi:hypothetical protein